MDNIDKFLTLFSDFNLTIEPKGRVQTKSNPSNSKKTSSDLKKTLNRLTREYKQAQKSFKHNKITRQELFDFEWRIFEIQEELKKLEDNDNI
jgi:hypothetical protein